MTTLVIVLLILIGLLLLVLEFFVMPGITVSGIGGVILLAAGIWMGYRTFGTYGGHWVLAISLLAVLLVIIISLRSGTWNRLMLKSAVEGKVELIAEELSISPGDEGIAVTRLNPVGKARVGDVTCEAHCPGHFIDQNSLVIVTKVNKNYIIVKPKN